MENSRDSWNPNNIKITICNNQSPNFSLSGSSGDKYRDGSRNKLTAIQNDYNDKKKTPTYQTWRGQRNEGRQHADKFVKEQPKSRREEIKQYEEWEQKRRQQKLDALNWRKEKRREYMKRKEEREERTICLAQRKEEQQTRVKQERKFPLKFTAGRRTQSRWEEERKWKVRREEERKLPTTRREQHRRNYGRRITSARDIETKQTYIKDDPRVKRGKEEDDEETTNREERRQQYTRNKVENTSTNYIILQPVLRRTTQRIKPAEYGSPTVPIKINTLIAENTETPLDLSPTKGYNDNMNQIEHNEKEMEEKFFKVDDDQNNQNIDDMEESNEDVIDDLTESSKMQNVEHEEVEDLDHLILFQLDTSDLDEVYISNLMDDHNYSTYNYISISGN